jgi:hypothetical protein
MRQFLFLVMTSVASAQTPTTYTGVIKDLAQNVVTSGQVTFALAPSTDSALPGVGKFTPSTVTCINVDGTLSGFANGAPNGACFITSNPALSPPRTSYRVCIQPKHFTLGSCFYDYALTASKNITTVAPTLSTGPLNNGGVPGPALSFLGVWNSATSYQTGQAVSYNNVVYISLATQNFGNNPATSPSSWSVVVSTASLIAAPNVSQTKVQPSGTSFQSNSTNGELNASLYPGTDIGAKVMAAIADLPGRCGTVMIPAGSYTQTTTITKPACVGIRGQGAYNTIFNWTPSKGTALVLADVGGTYPQEEVSDL